MRRPGQLSRYSDSLWAERFGDRIPMAARFSAHVQTGLMAHPASYTPLGTGSFPRWLPTPSSADVKERVELYISFLLGLRGLF